MQQAYSWSNIVVARAGASTISELRVIQRPSVLIPYPLATHNHQYHNAKNLSDENRFHVSLLDNKLDKKLLAAKIATEIKTIMTEKLYSQSEAEQSTAAETVKKEIYKCLELNKI